ncbi:MAG: hypothetical protein ACKVQC_08475, partial [Elusimicrobiota bacterium]
EINEVVAELDIDDSTQAREKIEKHRKSLNDEIFGKIGIERDRSDDSDPLTASHSGQWRRDSVVEQIIPLMATLTTLLGTLILSAWGILGPPSAGTLFVNGLISLILIGIPTAYLAYKFLFDPWHNERYEDIKEKLGTFYNTEPTRKLYTQHLFKLYSIFTGTTLVSFVIANALLIHNNYGILIALVISQVLGILEHLKINWILKDSVPASKSKENKNTELDEFKNKAESRVALISKWFREKNTENLKALSGLKQKKEFSGPLFDPEDGTPLYDSPIEPEKTLEPTELELWGEMAGQYLNHDIYGSNLSEILSLIDRFNLTDLEDDIIIHSLFIGLNTATAKIKLLKLLFETSTKDRKKLVLTILNELNPAEVRQYMGPVLLFENLSDSFFLDLNKKEFEFFMKTLSGSIKEWRSRLGKAQNEINKMPSSDTRVKPLSDIHFMQVVVMNAAVYEDEFKALLEIQKHLLHLQKFYIRLQILKAREKGKKTPFSIDVFTNGKIDLGLLLEDENPLKKFMTFLEKYDLENIIVIGGAVRDIIMSKGKKTPKDIDFTVHLSKESTYIQPTVTASSNETQNASRKILAKLAKAINSEFGTHYTVDDFTNGKEIKLYGISIQYAGPNKLLSQNGEVALAKRIYISGENTFQSGSTGPSLLRMGIDFSGQLYGHQEAIGDLLDGIAGIGGDGKNFTMSGAIRLLRIKHQFGLKIEAEGYALIKLAIQQFTELESKNQKDTISIIVRLTQDVINNAKNKRNALNELKSLGIILLINENEGALSPTASHSGQWRRDSVVEQIIPLMATLTTLLGTLILSAWGILGPPSVGTLFVNGLISLILIGIPTAYLTFKFLFDPWHNERYEDIKEKLGQL